MNWGKQRTTETVLDLRNLVGFKAYLKSRRIGQNKYEALFLDKGREYTIEAVLGKITSDGKLYPFVKFEGLKEYFSIENIEILDTNFGKLYLPAICGEVLCDETVCGYNVSPILTVDTTDTRGGIVLRDLEGNIITDRIVNIVNANVETLSTDTDDVTDVNLNIIGKELD